LGEEYSSVCW
jgi:hypothetical protein